MIGRLFCWLGVHEWDRGQIVKCRRCGISFVKWWTE